MPARDHDAEFLAALDKWMASRKISKGRLELARAWLRNGMEALRVGTDLPAAALDSRLARLQFRYEKRLKEIDLPKDGFQTKEQAAAAGRLAMTYIDLKKVQAELGLPISPKSPRVTEAERLRMDFIRNHPKV